MPDIIHQLLLYHIPSRHRVERSSYSDRNAHRLGQVVSCYTHASFKGTMHTSLRAPHYVHRTTFGLRSSTSQLLQPDRRICTVKSRQQKHTVYASMGTPVLYTYPLAYNPFKAALVSSEEWLCPCLRCNIHSSSWLCMRSSSCKTYGAWKCIRVAFNAMSWQDCLTWCMLVYHLLCITAAAAAAHWLLCTHSFTRPVRTTIMLHLTHP